MSSSVLLTMDEIKKTVHSLASKYPNIETVTLIGSYAHGEATGESDLDFIVDISGENISDTFFGITEDLENAFDKEIDLLTPDGVEGSPIRDSLLSGGIIVYVNNKQR